MAQQNIIERQQNVSKFAQEVASNLIKMLEEGGLPAWRKCWQAAVLNSPCNGASKKNYHGINALWLAYKMDKEGWQDTRFYTFKQIKDLGGHVKKGAKGTGVEYWLWHGDTSVKDVEVDDATGEVKEVEKRVKPFSVKYYTVFNAEQCEGLPEVKAPEKPVQAWTSVERAENIMQASGVPFFYNTSDDAYYSPASDEIHLPPRENFFDVESFYSTALHELTHATGHASRCNRSQFGGFGSALYAQEELRAEIGSVMLCAICNIKPADQNKQHAAYIKSWLKKLKEDPKEIFKAANDAEKAVNWLLDKEAKAEKKAATKEVAASPAPTVKAAKAAVESKIYDDTCVTGKKVIVSANNKQFVEEIKTTGKFWELSGKDFNYKFLINKVFPMNSKQVKSFDKIFRQVDKQILLEVVNILKGMKFTSKQKQNYAAKNIEYFASLAA